MNMEKPGVAAARQFSPVKGPAIVAWIDILGYKRLHASKGPGFMHELHDFAKTLIEGMPETKSFVNRPSPGGPPSGISSFKPHAVSFTDTIVLYYPDPKPYQVEYLLQRVRDTAKQWLVNGVPLRGGIAYGETFIDDAPLRIYGEGPLCAQALESSLDEIAICIHESVTKEWPDVIRRLEARAHVVNWVQNIKSKNGLPAMTLELKTIAWPPSEPQTADWWARRLQVHVPAPSEPAAGRVLRASGFAEAVAQLQPRREDHEAWTRQSQAYARGKPAEGGAQRADRRNELK